ncbi:hypothetical protein Scep_020876 [Stephania cephalantha]|uniref:Uncharacterized protein n=1 Tax=Stephania cephalantha TaxID=152367 RepID=A0AAP0F512_9MAGN
MFPDLPHLNIGPRIPSVLRLIPTSINLPTIKNQPPNQLSIGNPTTSSPVTLCSPTSYYSPTSSYWLSFHDNASINRDEYVMLRGKQTRYRWNDNPTDKSKRLFNKSKGQVETKSTTENFVNFRKIRIE